MAVNTDSYIDAKRPASLVSRIRLYGAHGNNYLMDLHDALLLFCWHFLYCACSVSFTKRCVSTRDMERCSELYLLVGLIQRSGNGIWRPEDHPHGLQTIASTRSMYSQEVPTMARKALCLRRCWNSTVQLQSRIS